MSFARSIGLAVAAAAMAAPALAQDTGWTTVGRTAVGPDSSSGTIQVRWDPDFRQAMFCVDGHGMRLDQATLRLEDGSTRVVKLRQTLADGACSKPLSIARKTKLAAVDIAYDSGSLDGAQAKVQLTAR